MDSKKIKETIISRGVINLQEFGYKYCDKENILTDEVYSAFFRSMLEDNLGGPYDKEIKEILELLPKP